MKARINLGERIIELPVEYLEQQTSLESVFENVPSESVDVTALVEANRTIGTKWYLKHVIGEDRKALHISVPTEFIEWED